MLRFASRSAVHNPATGRLLRFLSGSPRPRLTYFDTIGGRGEPIRFVLKLAKVDFDDDMLRPQSEEYQTRKERGEFSVFAETGGGLPVYVEGGKLYYESNAILRMLGARHGFYSTDPATAWEIDICMEKVEQVWQHKGYTPITLYLMAAKAGGSTDEAASNLVAMYTEFASWGELQLKKHGKAFLAGTDGPTIADFRYIVQFSDSIYNEGTALDAGMVARVKEVVDTKPTFKRWIEETMLPLLKGVRTEGIKW